MHLKPIDRGKFLIIPLLFALLATAAFAGTNEGFTASLTGASKVKDPEIGQTIQIGVEIQNAAQAKGGLITAKYDAAVFEFTGFTPGSLISGLLSLPGTPVLQDDGLTQIQGGGTQLTGSPAAGDGLLGTMAFKVIGEIPAEGAFISIVDVQIQASASDKDNLKYDVGAFGVALTRTILYTMSGSITSEEGLPVEGATVVATAAKAAAGGTKLVSRAVTDADGAYSLELPQDSYRLTILRPVDDTTLQQTTPYPTLLVMNQDQKLDLVIGLLGTLSGQVTDTAGNVVAGATVRATYGYKTAFEATFTTASGEDGRYVLKIPKATYTVSALPPRDSSLKPVLIREPVVVKPEATQDIQLIADFPNQLTDFAVIRGFDAATVTWSSSFPGLLDTVRYRQKGDEEWQKLGIEYPRALPNFLDRLSAIASESGRQLDQLSRNTLAPFVYLVAQDLNIADPAQVTQLAQPVLIALHKRHFLKISSLAPETEYEYQAKSVSLDGKLSAWSPFTPGSFETRTGPDLRPVKIVKHEKKPEFDAVTIKWATSRLASARVTLTTAEGETVKDTLFDEQGTLTHGARITGLQSGVEYTATIVSEGVGLDDLISEEDPLPALKMPPKDAADTQILKFKTKRALLPIVFLGPPPRPAAIGSENVKFNIRLNTPAKVVVAYGPVNAEASAKAAKLLAALQEGGTAPRLQEVALDVVLDALKEAYPEQVFSPENSDKHTIDIQGLTPSTEYRYRVIAFRTGDADSEETSEFNTFDWTFKNRGWNLKDLRFTTSSLDDVAPPAFISKPQVFKEGKVAHVIWVNDVATTGKIFLGTWTDAKITLGTSDEWGIEDLDDNGSPVFSQFHAVTIPTLELKTGYGYRVEVTAANDQTASWNPAAHLLQGSSKAARIMQPPGGAGRFTTDPTPDTQYPVIQSGPTITARTHDTAIIEWTTDEPANSDVRFGVAALDDQVTAGDNEISHKIVLTDLTPGATYSYIVGSTDASGNGATESGTAVFTTNPELDLTAPRITVAPQVIYKNNQSATIQWTTDEEATGELGFGPTDELGFVRTLLTTDKVHQITLTNLEANTDYYYQVSSTDLSNNGPTQSAVLSFTTDAQADLDPPEISGIVATPADSSAIITWTTDEQANSFVDFGTDSLELVFSVGAVENVETHEITLTKLTPGTQYFYRVGSVDRADNPPAESAIGSFTTLSEADTTPPSVPFGLSAATSNKQVLLTWDAELEFDLNGFKVYRRTGDAGFAAIASGLRATEFADLNVENGTTYEYQVTAIDRQSPPNESAPSASVEATPAASAAPSAPTGLTTNVEENHLRPTLAFTNVTSIGAGATLTYTLQVSTEEDFGEVTASISGLAEGSGDVDPGQTAWTVDRDLEEGSTYYWRVRAVEGDLLGSFSAAEQFKARAPVTLPGDFNNDDTVDFDDFFLFVDAFGQEATGELAQYDLSANGTVDFDDFFLFVDNFGKSATGKRWSVTQTVDDRAIFSVEAIGGTRTDDQGRVTVRVRADQTEQLKGFGLVLRYDPRAVIWENATPGPGHLLTSQGAQAPLFQVLAQTPGQLVIGSGITQGQPVSGHGLLAELNFRVIGAATTTRFDLTEALVARSGSDVRRVAQLHSAALRPQTFYLGANFPNPFNPTTSIEYGLPAAGPAELAIYDVLGRQVRTLMREETQPAGFYTVVWDGRDSAGRPVGSGIYFYRLQTPQFTRTAKMSLLK